MLDLATEGAAPRLVARDAGFGRSLRDEDISDAVDAASWRPAYARYAPE